MALAPPRSAAFPISGDVRDVRRELDPGRDTAFAHGPRAGLDQRRVGADRSTVALGMGAGEVQLKAGNFPGKPPGNRCKLFRCPAKDAGNHRFLCKRRKFVHEFLRGVRESHRVQEPVLQHDKTGTCMAVLGHRPDRFRDNAPGTEREHPGERRSRCPEDSCCEQEVVLERNATHGYPAGSDRYHPTENGC